jgi:hypothetical protein
VPLVGEGVTAGVLFARRLLPPGTSQAIDLRTIDRRPLASVGGWCSDCVAHVARVCRLLLLLVSLRMTVPRETLGPWLRRSVIRLRAALRFAREPQVETILREVIAHAEDRLAVLERNDLEAKEFRGR